MDKKTAEAIFAAHYVIGAGGYGVEEIMCSCDHKWRKVTEWRAHMVAAVTSKH